MKNWTKLFIVIVFCLLLFFVGCTDKKGTQKLLEQEGYIKVEITGLNFLSCGQYDWFRTGFIAYKNDKRISGTVCKGLLFKGKTIRFD